MMKFGKLKNKRAAMAAGAAVLVALGAAGGAGAVQATRPTIEMAPTVQTPIARLASTSGVVTVRGRVAQVYGDHLLVRDGSGQALIAAGREARGAVGVGQAVMVQGRYDDGQMRASYLVDQGGHVVAAGPRGPQPGGPKPGGPGSRDGHGPDGPPPPPPGCGPAGPGAMPPPPQGAEPVGNAAPRPPLGAAPADRGQLPPPPAAPRG